MKKGRKGGRTEAEAAEVGAVCLEAVLVHASEEVGKDLLLGFSVRIEAEFHQNKKGRKEEQPGVETT